MKKCNGLNNDVSEAALTRAAREAVAGALAGDFPIDPLIGRVVARPFVHRQRGQTPWHPDRARRRRRAGRRAIASSCCPMSPSR